MKKLLLPLVVAIVSLVITFFIFEIMSWYDFGGPITSIVLIICFIIIFLILLGLILLLKKKKNK